MSHNQKIFAVSFAAILFVGFFFFLGKFRYFSNPITRLTYKKYFLNEIVKNNRIDAEKFWEFRDFYAATTSSFKPENIPLEKPFFILSSGSLQSLDFLVLPTSPTIKKFVVPNNKKIILQTKNELIYEDGKNVVIRFAKEIPEMESANGFFRYFGVTLKQYSGYIWYNETVIKP